MTKIGNEIFGRPSLEQVVERQKRSSTTRFITRTLLRASPLLQLMPFVDDVQASSRQRRISYGYTRRNVARVGQLRDYNTDYAPKFAGGETDHTAILRPIGDSFELDRVFGDADPEYVEQQVGAMAPAVASKLADLIINGDSASNALEIDGLSKMLTGTSQVKTGLTLSLGDGGTAAQLAFRKNVAQISSAVRTMTSMGLRPVVLGNADIIASLELGGDVLGYGDRTTDYFGVAQVSTIGRAALIDVGMTTVHGTTAPETPNEVPVESVEIIPTVDGVTDLYVVGFSSVNGVTGLTLNGNGTSPVNYATNPKDAGAIRRYEVELVAGVAVLDERAVIKFEDVVI
ncbi:major capsid protein [Deinococcus lacus]|uniref:Major capsid protein n=1 Tax=Deinococcus lacus TaxID=392561 RepID=A0ABW1YBQ8_9DEIO